MKVTKESILEILQSVKDPEIPVLTVVDMGVVRDVIINDSQIHVKITPTYSGCPAMDTIAEDIKSELISKGFEKVTVELVMSPAWTTAWLTEDARQKLEEFGIAPPVEGTGDKRELFSKAVEVACPQCKSKNTRLVSQFGSTACKAQYQCNDCKEPFDYFKCL